MTRYECTRCANRYEGEVDCPKCGCGVATSVFPDELMTPSAPLPVIKPLVRPGISPAGFGASNPIINVTGYIRPSLAPKWDCPKANGGHVGGDFDPGYSAQRAAFLELLQKTRQEHDEMQEIILFRALGMTAEEAVANRHRISRHCHPEQDVFLVDGEPVVAIHKPVIRGDELVTSYQILRTLP